MGLQAIEAAPKDGSPVFLVDKDTGDMTATHWAVVQRLFQTEGTSIAYSPTHWFSGFKTVFMLAETYDARVLQSWRARGISGDLPKARELYERAQAGGIEDAKARIEALK
jgi:hypothetical protein